MRGVNKVMLVGRLGADPEVVETKNGTVVAKLTLATSEYYKPKDGEATEKTEWHRCVAFGKTATFLGEYAKKGDVVYISGKNTTRQYEKDEEKRYAHEVVVNEAQLLSAKPNGDKKSKKSKSDDDDVPSFDPEEGMDF